MSKMGQLTITIDVYERLVRQRELRELYTFHTAILEGLPIPQEQYFLWGVQQVLSISIKEPLSQMCTDWLDLMVEKRTIADWNVVYDAEEESEQTDEPL